MNSTTNKRRITKGLLLLMVALTAGQYARWTFENTLLAQMIVFGLEDRPFSYRALVPWLAHLLVGIGLNPSQALTALIVLSAIGLVYGIEYLITATRH